MPKKKVFLVIEQQGREEKECKKSYAKAERLICDMLDLSKDNVDFDFHVAPENLTDEERSDLLSPTPTYYDQNAVKDNIFFTTLTADISKIASADIVVFTANHWKNGTIQILFQVANTAGKEIITLDERYVATDLFEREIKENREYECEPIRGSYGKRYY